MKYQNMFILATLLLLIGCSETPEKAVKNGDVVSDLGVIGNIDKLDHFISEISNKKDSSVKITRFTKEGDPVFIRLNYTQNKIEVEEDPSKDRNGNKEKRKYLCTSITNKEQADEVHYLIMDCSPSRSTELLVVPK
ncbi:DUF4362 domain-containing protein [Paenibacillus sp. ATY16]|uniref:DUF4362 domain-containing protein n=1 Tax=Paenibacillus sp. ATY16 TaxID=1759312 RepID=UPI0013C334CD|nr:DUF4362 domain-containing protein [Paenibacillus sp. ATY16]MCK9859271.1 DUF4362 domain-containing protein [Paenibacillus sp. ATY16]